MTKILFVLIILLFQATLVFSQSGNEEYIYKEIVLNENEDLKIDSIISLIPQDSILKFQNKFDIWLESTNKPEIQVHSNPEKYKTKEFYEFQEFTLSLGKEYIALLIDFFKDHNEGVSYYLLLDITYNDYGFLLDSVRNEIHKIQYTELGERIIYTQLSFAFLYFKNILALIKIDNSELVITNISKRKNLISENFIVFPNPIKNEVNIQFEMNTSDYVTIKILDIYGRELEIITSKEIYPVGKHSIKWTLKNQFNKGTYILVFESMKLLKCKKIIIN